MDVIKALRDYVSKMVRMASGMKVLLLDIETTGIVSMVYSQSEILQEEVYLFERIDTLNREPMPHLKAFCFLRPTDENLQTLRKELMNPKYGAYYLFFTNVLSKQFLEKLAQSDEHEVVQEVQEFFGDYYAVNRDTWTLNLPQETGIANSDKWSNYQTRIGQGLLSCLLSLKICPYIRVQKSSPLAMLIGKDLVAAFQDHKSLFKFRVPEILPVLLILDRRDDPVTPLLTQWTYQAMVHELIGIKNDLVEVKASSLLDNVQQIVLSSQQDAFYNENMYKNFGDLGIAIKGLVDEYQNKQKLNKEIKTIEDMKRFVADYPEFKKLSGNVSKHVALMELLQNQITTRHLLDLSEVEQMLACHEGYSDASKKLEECLHNPKFDSNDLLRLVMLYALRYEHQKDFQQNITKFVNLLKERGLVEADAKLVPTILRYGGVQKRSEQLDMFDNKTILNTIRNTFGKGLTGITNIYTQHKPLLLRIVNDMLKPKGRFSDDAYPYIHGSPNNSKPQQILIFMIGGITFEEACCVNEFNNISDNNTKILLGGTTIHNSKSFMEGLKHFAESH